MIKIILRDSENDYSNISQISILSHFNRDTPFI